jgi:hypothetical protein
VLLEAVQLRSRKCSSSSASSPWEKITAHNGPGNLWHYHTLNLHTCICTGASPRHRNLCLYLLQYASSTHTATTALRRPRHLLHPQLNISAHCRTWLRSA